MNITDMDFVNQSMWWDMTTINISPKFQIIVFRATDRNDVRDCDKQFDVIVKRLDSSIGDNVEHHHHMSEFIAQCLVWNMIEKYRGAL